MVSDQQSENQPHKKTASEDYYNTVFERLSEKSSELAGAVAYALYKNAKRQWIQEFRTKNGRRPTADECKHHTSTQTDAILDAYMAQADQILAQYAQDIIKEESPRILSEALKGDFWPSFWASIAFMSVLAILVVIAALFGFGLPIQITIPSSHT
jgi:hypothetical protein